MIVAYFFSHNEGVEWGTLEHPDEFVAFTDLYECDGQIKAFATREEAEAWLSSLMNDDDEPDELEGDDEPEEGTT